MVIRQVLWNKGHRRLSSARTWTGPDLGGCGVGSPTPFPVAGSEGLQAILVLHYTVYSLSTLLSESPGFTPAEACVGGTPPPWRRKRRAFEGGQPAAVPIGKEIGLREAPRAAP